MLCAFVPPSPLKMNAMHVLGERMTRASGNWHVAGRVLGSVQLLPHLSPPELDASLFSPACSLADPKCENVFVSGRTAVDTINEVI